MGGWIWLVSGLWRFRLFGLLVCCLSGGVLSGFGGSGLLSVENYPLETGVAIRLYEAGWQGDDEALRGFFAAVVGGIEEEWMGEPVLRAVYGSACIGRMRLVSDFQKVSWFRKGERHLDEAVAAAPERMEPRFLRAVSFAVLPRRAGRVESVREDFGKLIEMMEGAAVPDRFRQAVFYHAGSFALRNRESGAEELLRRAVELEPESGLDRELLLSVLRAAENL